MPTYSEYSEIVSSTTATTIKTPPRPHLYFDTPVAVFKARVNMAADDITYPANSIDFDTVTLGAYTDIEPGMTLLLGTAEGLDDLGRTRVKIAEVDNIRIARSSKGIEDGTVALADNAYVTVLDDYRVWSKLPFFQLDTDGEVIEGTDFKDGNIPPGTNNTLIPPKANAGPWMAGMVDPDTGVLEVMFPGGGVNNSFALADGATITDYLWDIKDGTLTLNTLADAVIVATFPPGRRWVSLTVTDSNGVIHTSHCFVVSVDINDDPCIRGYQLNQSMEIKGQSLDINLYQDAPRTTYPDGTLVMLWWGNTQDRMDRSHIKFCGWIDNENFSMGRQKTGFKKTTTIHAVDVTGRLSALSGFPLALSRDTIDAQWSYMPSLDMHKAIWYAGYWHSTAFDLADFILPTGLRDYDSMRLDFSGASLFDQINTQANKIVPDHLFTCNTQGQLSVIRDWMLDNLSDRPAADPILTEDDYNELEATYNRSPKVYVLKSGAILSSTDWVTIDGEQTLPLVFSVAPGDAQAFGQGVQEQQENEGLALSQAELNICEGHRYARLNLRYGEFKWNDPTGYLFWQYEPAAVKRVEFLISATRAAQRGLDFTAAAGQVKGIQVDYNVSRQGTSIQASVTWEKEASGYPATTHIPEEDKGTDYTPDPPTTPPDSGVLDGQDLVAVIGDTDLYRTFDFQTPSGSGGPTWFKIPLTSGDTILTWVVDPFSPGYINGEGNIDGWLATTTKIYRVEDLFGGVSVETIVTFPTTALWRTIQASFGTYFDSGDNPWLVCVSYYGSAGGHTGTWATYSVDGGTTWAEEVLVSAEYDSGSSNPIGLYCSPKTPGLAYTIAHTETASPAATAGYVSLDWGATWTLMAVDSVGNPLPMWGIIDETNNTLASSGVSPSVSHAVVVTCDPLTATTVTGHQYRIVFAPPEDAVRAEISGFWRHQVDTNQPGWTSNAQTFNQGDSNNTDRTSDLAFHSAPTTGGVTSQDFTVTWELQVGQVDWDKSREDFEASPPITAGGYCRWTMQVSASRVLSGTVTNTLQFTAVCTEIELDGGIIYTPASGAIAPINGQGGEIHLPWEDNDDESIFYYGSIDRSGSPVIGLQRSVAGVSSDISQGAYGINSGHFAIRAHDSDRQFMVLAGESGAGSSGVWVSSDAGDTWDEIVAPSAGDHYQAAFGGDTQDVIFIWGPALYMGYSTDFGATIDDRSGNLAALSATKTVGIAGGPTG